MRSPLSRDSCRPRMLPVFSAVLPPFFPFLSPHDLIKCHRDRRLATLVSTLCSSLYILILMECTKREAYSRLIGRHSTRRETADRAGSRSRDWDDQRDMRSQSRGLNVVLFGATFAYVEAIGTSSRLGTFRSAMSVYRCRRKQTLKPPVNSSCGVPYLSVCIHVSTV